MHPVVGIFTRRQDAEVAAAELETAGIDRGRIIVLTPGSGVGRLAAVPTRDAEAPGVGKALGTITGAAAGAAGGMQLGAVVSTLLVPGLGPLADDNARAAAARAVFTAAAAEDLDAARERWWSGLRDTEAAHYEPFAEAESDYRRGFECALGAD